MPTKHREIATQFSQITDALVIALMYYVAHAIRNELAYRYPLQFSMIADFRYYKWLYLIILPVAPLLLDINGYYNRPLGLRPGHTLTVLMKSVLLSALLVIALMY